MEPSFPPKMNQILFSVPSTFGNKKAAIRNKKEIRVKIIEKESLKIKKYKDIKKNIPEKIKPNVLLDRVFLIKSFLSSIKFPNLSLNKLK